MAVGAVVVVVGLALLRLTGVAPDARASGSEAPSAAQTAALAATRRLHTAQSKQAETGMTIVAPRIGLDAPVVHLGTGKDDQLEVPRQFDRAGWWSDGPRPGNPGPAVIVGHVDSAEGPAVFQRIHELGPGDEVFVRDKRRPPVRFVVTRTAEVDKTSFPTGAVYGKVAEPELRLITCSGRFDPAARHYTDNLIVFATLSPTAPAAPVPLGG